jgi:hypothetical protein
MRRALASLAVLMAATLPVACGGDELSPAAAVADAATKTEQAGSSRMAFTAQMSGGGLPIAVEIAGGGEFDYESRQGRLTYDLGGLLGQDDELEVVVDGLVLYVRWPGDGPSPLPEGKRWYRIDLGKVAEHAGLDVNQLSQLSQADPTQMLLYLRGASSEIEELGSEKVRGEATTHYRAQVDLREAIEASLERIPGEMRDSLRASVDTLAKQLGTVEIPVDVWIDGDGLARRVATEFELGTDGTSEELQMDVRMEFYDFGVDVTAEPPAEDETVDLLELMGTAE